MITTNTLQDIDEIFNLYKQASDFKKVKSNIQWPEFGYNMIETEIKENRLYKFTIEGKIACIWSIAFEDPQIWEEQNSDPSLYIHRIATHPSFRGQKFVEQIAIWAKSFAEQNNKQYVRMDTVGLNPKLVNYYVNCGFTYLGVKTPANTQGLPAHYQNISINLFQLKV
ncbi:GNAT family N-acetyltransferase [Chryseobacterium gallinarum]|uniref:GNAT family N-acetyltransferase n=2 Tax=Chryseobacterium TaxID=59732 RepID=A0ABX6KRS2_CHRGL|nr:GNAT family N-acetyltransferase [Chryseobacterium gallinarum]QIY91270.1 GNAT family N-acetyltransferase [Chryseobacterium gallinarum]